MLQERTYERVGSNQPRKANVRFIAATHRDLETAVQSGTIRGDLYYRINVFPIVIPPLRDRRNDIVQLADFFVDRYVMQNDKQIRRISTPAINMLMAYHWPGNVRELENSIERAVLLSDDGAIYGRHLPLCCRVLRNLRLVVPGVSTNAFPCLKKMCWWTRSSVPMVTSAPPHGC